MFEQSGIRGVIINSGISEVFRKKIFCLQKAVKKAGNRGGRRLNALLSKLETGPRYRFNIISISISYSFVFFFRGFVFLTGVYVEYSLQNHFVFLFPSLACPQFYDVVIGVFITGDLAAHHI